MNKKANSLVYVGGSLLLVVAAIAVTTILNHTSNSSSSQEDIRAKAGASNSLQLTGVVSSVDQSSGAMKVDNVQFASSASSENLGLWTVTSPQIDLSTLPVGAKVLITVEAPTFLINDHTMLATQIKTVQ